MLPKINPVQEKNKIVNFIRSTLKNQGFTKAIIGLSGGIDSATSFYLLKETLPPENIFVALLDYFHRPDKTVNRLLQQFKIPKQNIYKISIKSAVDELIKFAGVEGKEVPVITGAKNTDSQYMSRVDANYRDKLKPTSLMHVQEDVFKPLKKIRLGPPAIASLRRLRAGNIMARVRMIILFDLAKKHNALVCGTENKTEYLLGYFTRFGDEASDIEPIKHLYKTQVYQLAKHLGVPDQIINRRPTAGLWSSQTDEGEFGFSYEEADNVLYLYSDKKISTEKIIKMGYLHAKKILAFVKKNEFKRKTPYCLY